MPPKAKFLKDEIVQAALDIVRIDGFAALTARSLGEKLGSSARPIFTVFKSMEDVQCAVIAAAKACYGEYVERGLAEPLPFKGVGMQYILFAVNEPKLFQLLFMSEQAQVPNLSGILPLIDESYEKILSSIRLSYNLDDLHAQRLYQHLWIYTHGIAALCATKTCGFTGEEISEMLTEVFVSILKKIKEERND